MRVRWALEEVKQPYDVAFLSFTAMKEPTHLALQPFGQIPTFQEKGIALFETGAIVLHIAQCFQGLLPLDAKARARAVSWVFAALNTVEPPVLEREAAYFHEREKAWYGERLALVDERLGARLSQVSAYLGDTEWLEDAFSAGDLMMASVLVRLKSSAILENYPNLAGYLSRAESRPAYQRAFAAQLAAFEKSKHTNTTMD